MKTKYNNADYNEKGVTLDIGMPASGEAESITKATVSEGTIEIRDKENQKQALAGLNRDTNNSLNKLGEIFYKTKMEERQELANLFGELAYNEIHKLAKKNGWEDGDPEKDALYALIGGIMSELTGNGFLTGASASAINEMVQKKLSDQFEGEPDKHQWASAIIGGIVSQLVAGNAQAGASTAASGTKNNELYIWQEKERAEELEDLLKKGDYLGYDLKNKMYKQLSDANQLYDLDSSYLSDEYNTDTITEDKKKEYLQYVTPYLQNSLEDQYIKTVAVRATKALNENSNTMKANEVYIFSDSIKIPIKIKGNKLLYINYTTVVTKNGHMILAPGATISIPKTGESLLPFSSEVYKGPVRNVDFNSDDIDRDIVNIIRGYSGSFSGSMIGAGTLSISSDSTLTNYGAGVSIENVGGVGISFNGGNILAILKTIDKRKICVIGVLLIVCVILGNQFMKSADEQELRNEAIDIIYKSGFSTVIYDMHRDSHYWYTVQVPTSQSCRLINYYNSSLQNKGWIEDRGLYSKDGKIFLKTKNNVKISVVLKIMKQSDEQTLWRIDVNSWN